MNPNMRKILEAVRAADKAKVDNPESVVAIHVSASMAADEDVKKELGLDGSSVSSHGFYGEYHVTVVPDITILAYDKEGKSKVV